EPSARLTLDAYVRMRKELEALRTDGRTQMGERLLRARELGDIRENAEYDAAKNEQGLMEARIRDLERKLKDPDILEVAESGDIRDGLHANEHPDMSSRHPGQAVTAACPYYLAGSNRTQPHEGA